MNKIDIYNTKRKTTFIGVPHGTKVPPTVAAQYGVTTILKTVDLDDPRSPIAMDKANVAADVAANGYAEIGATIKVEVDMPTKKA